PNPLPKDELFQLQLIIYRLSNHLTTRIDALRELGEYDAENKLKEIKKELLEWQNLMFEAENPERITPTEVNLQGIDRDEADLAGYTGRNHSREQDFQ